MSLRSPTSTIKQQYGGKLKAPSFDMYGSISDNPFEKFQDDKNQFGKVRTVSVVPEPEKAVAKTKQNVKFQN